jgi:hypothetical protein
MEARKKYRIVEAMARARSQLEGAEYDQARAEINQAIRTLRAQWQIELPETGRDVTDFFTYETAPRPDWLLNKGPTKRSTP